LVCVSNEGAADAAAFQIVAAMGQVREVQHRPGLVAGGQVCRDISNLTVELVADASEDVVESDEGNNRVVAGSPTYTPPPPCRETPTSTPRPPPADLVVEEHRHERVPMSWHRGECRGGCNCALPGEDYYVGMDVRVSNRGAGPAGQFVVGTEPLVDVTWSVPSLGAGQTTWLGWQEGWADVVTVDADNRVAESDETNNRRVIPATPEHTAPATCTQASQDDTPTPATTSPPEPTASVTRTPSPTGTPTTALEHLQVYLPSLPQR
jgi:hypothetical protein